MGRGDSILLNVALNQSRPNKKQNPVILQRDTVLSPAEAFAWNLISELAFGKQMDFLQ
jgi:hypothetical protein